MPGQPRLELRVNRREFLKMLALSAGASAALPAAAVWDKFGVEALPLQAPAYAGGLMVNDPSGPVDMQLKIDMSSPFTVQRGLLDLDIRDGIVHTSVGTGDFSTLSLPPVGWNVGNLLALPGLTNEFNLDYDLISLGAVQELKFELSGDGSGIVPEPAALVFFSLGGMFLMRRRNS